MNPWFRKTVAGRPVRPGATKSHYVTRVGSNQKQRFTPMLEMTDLDSGIRYALKTINVKAAQLFRRTFEQGGLKNLNYSVERCSVGNDEFNAVVVHSEKKGEVPVFKIGKVFGVRDKFVNLVTEKLAEAKTQRAATAVVSLAARKIGITFRQILGREPSHFPEFKESAYGSRFYMCSDAINRAYCAKLAALKKG